ncbi:universal stress protein, partial [Halomonas ramblicola]|uniref:universal stress protein n=1 Tax=Halomonas ramblicola TaxID=747349 RepID=UPI0025B2DB1E
VEDGVTEPGSRQRNGTLVETLEELADEIRLLVVGKRGETAHQDSGHLGSNLERVVRTLHRPILMVPDAFKRPEKVMIAFDGSKTTRKGVEMLARSPLFDGVPVHVVIVGAETGDNRSQFDWALKTLRDAGHAAEGAIRAGEVEATLRAYQEEQGIDLLVMGAYGHSRIRHLLVGSTTTAMLRKAQGPVLLLR